MTFRLIVTGSRTWGLRERADQENRVMLSWLEAIRACHPDLLVVHGDAKGADTFAKHWARKVGVPDEPHPADWRELGKKAGILRNLEMLNAGADLVVAFSDEPITPGTAHCVQAAAKAGIPVQRCYG